MYEISPNVSVFVLTGKIIRRLKLQVICRAVPNVVAPHQNCLKLDYLACTCPIEAFDLVKHI